MCLCMYVCMYNIYMCINYIYTQYIEIPILYPPSYPTPFEHGKTSKKTARSPVAGTRPASKHPCPGGIRGGIRQIQAVKHEKLEKTSLKQQKNLEKLGKNLEKLGKTGKNW